VSDIKRIVEAARFNIGAKQLFEAYMVSKGQVSHADRRTPQELIFGIKDLLIDAVMMDLRPTPGMNIWKKKIPMDVIDYCYKMVPYRRCSFVWDVREDGNTAMDYIVCVFPDQAVAMSREYKALYDETIVRFTR